MASVQGRGWRRLTSRLAEGNWTLAINLSVSSTMELKGRIKSESTVIAQRGDSRGGGDQFRGHFLVKGGN